ncbi:PspC domain-containing protein [Permianibacter sp. IMCC34836]|uniref:PspC domain-containing protein n=1 Tax=Permianibacter fluminis TaxID=2738515 RepID=UPI001552323D|nr:PspC domain-containing protein [Permianibacter fluminis]NQD38728.1 PspC domain-containing protein [Permianibacter fluminis]
MAANRPRELYRDPAHGKVAGVCAGIGQYFGWPVWPIRFAVVLLAVFTQVFPLVAAYLIAWFILDPVSKFDAPGLRGQVDGWVMQTKRRWDEGSTEPVRPPTDREPQASAGEAAAPSEAQQTARHQPTRPQTVPSAPSTLVGLEFYFGELERQVQAMERHVTEPAFVLRQQFKSL